MGLSRSKEFKRTMREDNAVLTMFSVFKVFENDVLLFVPSSAYLSIHPSIDHFLDIDYVLNIR